jgi:histidinol-phosphate/aromatic aminotransferase/cobyric acid decarboxylase-like protein
LPNINNLIEKLKNENYDLFVLVNPNSPTGQTLKKEEMQSVINSIPKNTFLWIDETYIEYTGENNSMEQVACQYNNVIVCKSMSKVYALSGVRCAYLVCGQKTIDRLKPFSPPWAVSLPAQIAGVAALNDPEYYIKCYNKTHLNKELLVIELKKNKEVSVLSGVTNSILMELPKNYDIKVFLKECQNRNLFLRNVENMGENWGSNLLRLAVKDNETNIKIADILNNVLLNF